MMDSTDPQLVEKMDQLETAAMRIGLHQMHWGVIPVTDEHGHPVEAGEVAPDGMLIEGPPKVIVANYLIGDLAWDDRVQHPEKYADSQATAPMESDLNKSLFDETRTRAEDLLKRMEDGDDGEGGVQEADG